MEPKWLNNPRYQRAVQKMMSLDPTRRAILDTVIADEAFADAEMRKRLALMTLAARKKAQDRNLTLNEKRMAHDKERANVRYDLASQEFDMQKDDADESEMLGYANIGLAGLRGYTDLKEKNRQTKFLRDLASLYKR